MTTIQMCPCTKEIEKLNRELKYLRQKNDESDIAHFKRLRDERSNRRAWEKALAAMGISIQEGKVIRSHSS